VEYWECKACTALTKAEIGACWKCGLERGADVPVINSISTQAAVSKPKLARLGHALPSFLVFVVLGPAIGLFAFLLEQPTSNQSVFEFVVPFGLIGAYVIGGYPALLAGLFYSLACVALVFVVKRIVVNGFIGALLGACVAPLAILTWAHLLISIPSVREMRINEISPWAAIAAVICGAISGWLFPVGRASVKDKH
jgi:hypothetical protein